MKRFWKWLRSWRPRTSLMGALVVMAVMAVFLGVNMTPRKMLVNYDRRGRSPLVLEYEYGWPATMLENGRIVDETRDARCLAEIGKRLAEIRRERALREEDLLGYGELFDVEFDGEWRWGGLAVNIAIGLAIVFGGAGACEYVVRPRERKRET